MNSWFILKLTFLRYITEVQNIYSATRAQRNIQLIKLQQSNKSANKGAIVPWVGFTTSVVGTILAMGHINRKIGC